MIHTKTNNRVKKTLISMAVLGMAFFLLGCYKQQTQGEVEEYVANTVPEKAKLVGYEEQQSKSGTVYCYIFKSESRDLEFRVFSSRGGGAIGGYTLTQYYDVGRDNYYLEKMRPLLTSCENSEMYVSLYVKFCNEIIIHKRYTNSFIIKAMCLFAFMIQ